MRRTYCLPSIILINIFLFTSNGLLAQDNAATCKVELKNLEGSYSGECKNGLGNGKGEAKGLLHRYSGLFKNGLPNGKGTYYYSDSAYYTGNFQDGIKEGKGETHYLRSGMPDSLVAGYWSADEFRGKTYKTYTVSQAPFFDRINITPSSANGNSITFEISTTTGAPNGAQASVTGSGNVLTIREVIATDGTFIKKLNTFATGNKFSVNYELSKFPINLQVIISTGDVVNLELYKAANWTARFYSNR